MLETSEQLNELFTALSRAQGEIRPALKDRENPHLRSKYADLGSVWEACRIPDLADLAALTVRQARQVKHAASGQAQRAGGGEAA